MKRLWHDYSELMIQWGIILSFGMVVYMTYQYSQYKDRNLIDYLSNHRCEELGQVGQPGQYVYKCDNGLYLENDLRKETGT